MIPLDLFQQRLKIVKDEFNWIETSVDKFVNDCPFVEDMANGVPSSHLSKIIENSILNLFLSVCEPTKLDEVVDLVGYYIWEDNFGGVIEVNGKEYNLSDDSQLYDYLLTL